MGKRRKSREIAMQALYMLNSVDCSIDEICTFEWLPEPSDQDTLTFSEKIIRGTLHKIEQIDDIIIRYAKNWKFDRIESIDKTILRMSIYSLQNLTEIPAAVTINEAIELGKRFGGDNSGTFINGILDSVRKHELHNS
ncbi:MAG: transcription antitermination factor NusB [Spirochaetes bacterium]|jgi:N utilization substance protein B|nr:transcription antitermination factor NusB [Spirochaetota bacterium]